MTASGGVVIRRLVFAVAVVLGVVAGGGVASAYPPGGPQVGTSASAYDSGSMVQVFASGFSDCAGEDIMFTFTGPDGAVSVLHATIGADGAANVTLPAGAVGEYTLRAEAGCGWASTSFSVRDGSKPLPRAGSDTAPVLLVAGGLVVGGVGFLFVAWRRREHDRGRR